MSEWSVVARVWRWRASRKEARCLSPGRRRVACRRGLASVHTGQVAGIAVSQCPRCAGRTVRPCCEGRWATERSPSDLVWRGARFAQCGDAWYSHSSVSVSSHRPVRTRTHVCVHTHTHSNAHTITHTLYHTQHTQYHTHTVTYTDTDIHSITHTQSRTHSHTHTITHTLYHTQPHTHAHEHTHKRALWPISSATEKDRSQKLRIWVTREVR